MGMSRRRACLGFLLIVGALLLLFQPAVWAAGTPAQIKVATNRYVINDDPMVEFVVGGCVNGNAIRI